MRVLENDKLTDYIRLQIPVPVDRGTAVVEILLCTYSLRALADEAAQKRRGGRVKWNFAQAKVVSLQRRHRTDRQDVAVAAAGLANRSTSAEPQAVRASYASANEDGGSMNKNAESDKSTPPMRLQVAVPMDGGIANVEILLDIDRLRLLAAEAASNKGRKAKRDFARATLVAVSAHRTFQEDVAVALAAIADRYTPAKLLALRGSYANDPDDYAREHIGQRLSVCAYAMGARALGGAVRLLMTGTPEAIEAMREQAKKLTINDQEVVEVAKANGLTLIADQSDSRDYVQTSGPPVAPEGEAKDDA